MKKISVVMIVMFAMLIALVGVSKPASAIQWHVAGSGQLKATNKKVAENSKDIKSMAKNINVFVKAVGKDKKATDKRLTTVEKRLDGHDVQLASQSKRIDVVEKSCSVNSSSAKPTGKTSATIKRTTKKSSAKKHVATPKPVVSATPKTQAGWLLTSDGKAVSKVCSAADEGSDGQFGQECVEYVYGTYFGNPSTSRDVLLSIASVRANKSDGDKTRKVVVADGTETRDDIAQLLGVINALSADIDKMIASTELSEEQRQAMGLMKAVFDGYTQLDLRGRQDSLARQQYCSAVGQNLVFINGDPQIKQFFADYYGEGWETFLRNESAKCQMTAAQANAPAEKKKRKNVFLSFLNGLRKISYSSVTQGLCLNVVNKGGKCNPDLLKAIQGGALLYWGISTNSDLNDKWLGKNPPSTAVGNNGNGPVQPVPGNGPAQPLPQATTGSPGNGQDGGGYSGTANGTTGNQNYPNTQPQVPTSTTTAPPMANPAIDLPGQLIQGAPGTSTFTPIAGRSTNLQQGQQNHPHGPKDPPVWDNLGSSF